MILQSISKTGMWERMNKNLWSIAFWIKMYITIFFHYWSNSLTELTRLNWYAHSDKKKSKIEHSVSWQPEYILQDISVYVDYQIILCKIIKWRITYSIHTFMSKYHSSTIYFPLYTVKGWVFWKKMFRWDELKSIKWYDYG